MDIILHAAWSYIFFAGTSHMNLDWAMFFGTFPDIIAFAPGVIQNIFVHKKIHLKHHVLRGRPKHEIPQYIHTLYNLTHSLAIALPIAIIALALAFLFSKTRPWFLLAWPLHIIIDIPTHDKGDFPTPFLWPFSNFKFKGGVSWSQRNILIINYFLIAILILVIQWIT